MYKYLVSGVALSFLVFARADSPEENRPAIAYVLKLQTPGGGFLPRERKLFGDQKPLPTLRATVAAIRALHYLGGKVPNPGGCARFVAGCQDPSGGFADRPGGKPDVFSTAVGLMAVVELKMPLEKYESKAVRFLRDQARTFEDIRIAAAGLEAIKKPSGQHKKWLGQVREMKNADGTFGKGPEQARATGGTVALILRLGGEVDNRERVLKVLRDGQRADGGFGKGKDSDLETTYRIMRAFVMLKERPADVPALRGFIRKCQNADGGFGVRPGEPSTVGAVYFAAIIGHWLEKK